MALDESCTKRDYLFGRILAIADQIEYRALKKDDMKGEVRETNAQRYMCAFSQKPALTWKVIEERLLPYWSKLNEGSRRYFRKQLDDAMDLFEVDDFENQDSLGSLYLLGYHSQLIALRNKKQEEE